MDIVDLMQYLSIVHWYIGTAFPLGGSLGLYR